jgi:hypothetical protein
MLLLMFGFAAGFAVRHFSQPLMAKAKEVEKAVNDALK